MGIVPVSQLVPWQQSLMPAPSKLVTGKQIRVDVVYGVPTGTVPYAAHLIQAIGPKLGWQVKVIEAASQTPQATNTAVQQAVLDKPTAIIAGGYTGHLGRVGAGGGQGRRHLHRSPAPGHHNR